VRIIRFGIDATAGLRLQAYPNPVVNELRITIPNTWQEKQVNYEPVQWQWSAGKTYCKQTS